MSAADAALRAKEVESRVVSVSDSLSPGVVGVVGPPEPPGLRALDVSKFGGLVRTVPFENFAFGLLRVCVVSGVGDSGGLIAGAAMAAAAAEAEFLLIWVLICFAGCGLDTLWVIC